MQLKIVVFNRENDATLMKIIVLRKLIVRTLKL